jgi:hypothetical protein
MADEQDPATVVDFETGKVEHLHKRKEAKVDALRTAFRLARGDKGSAGTRKKRSKSRRK